MTVGAARAGSVGVGSARPGGVSWVRFVSWRTWLVILIGVVMLVIGLAVAIYPPLMQTINESRQASVSQSVEEHVQGWPYPKAEDMFKEARKYNEDLFKSGQTELGTDVRDVLGASSATAADDDDPLAKRYDDELKAGSDGVMGSIVIPKISVNLPIYHGTSDESLLAGAGHTFGSSLPVGGESTHSIIAAHRALPDKLMFTRLDEMKVGDFFQVKVMGETLSYRVDHIWVVKPDDFSHLKIKEGEDRVTLVTCTPYSINTHRLLVSGVRYTADSPKPDSQKDDWAILEKLAPILATLACPTLLIISWTIRRKLNDRHHPKHKA
ncbi:class C sortase [Bifidobacterium tissieri]|uniref:Class C sortase n=1 Tax=Bifidobacterium tissieri TaxID=1630162 RepID=A0A5M9ZWT3_9BIFI|nr:class C sortase [Bifidobacterium tissieri]KAA8831978.1 class C sortase [Bifidobacterium tissieri]